MHVRTTATALAALVPLSVCVAATSPASAATAGRTPAVAAPSDGSGTGGPGAAQGTAPKHITGLHVRSTTRDTRAAARAFLRSNARTAGVVSPDTTLRAPASSAPARSGDVTAERFEQVHDGVPVLGGQYVVRVRTDAHGTTVIGTSGTFTKGLTVSTTPKITAARAADAGRLALVRARVDRRKATVTTKGLVVLPAGQGRLAYRVLVVGRKVVDRTPVAMELLVDARTGALIGGWNRMQMADQPVTTTGKRLTTSTVPLHLTKTAKAYEFRDTSRKMAKGADIRTYDAQGRDWSEFAGKLPAKTPLATTGSVPAPESATKRGFVDAHWASGEVFEYYKNKLGRNAIDGKGSTMTSVVGVTEGGGPFVNAFWDGDKMVYGGGGSGYRPFSAALDVVGHEMTHGVIEHTADLEYFGQSGAVNEGLADYFGNAIQDDVEGISMHLPEAALLGEDLCSNQPKPDCALRDFNDKRTTWQDFEGVFGDNAGVHINSTIVTGALWDVRKRLGGDRADKLVYTALTHYMTPTSGFSDTRTAVLAAADQLGYSPAQKATIAGAFSAHGIVPGWERQIGMDTTTLYQGLDSSVGIFNGRQRAAAGQWVTSDDDTKLKGLTGVWGGRTTDPKSAKRYSPDDGWTHDLAATDGRTVLWESFDMSNPKTTSRLWSRDLKSGKSTKVWETKELIASTGVSGGTKVVATLNPDTLKITLWAGVDGKPLTKVNLAGDLMGPPSVNGTTIGYSLFVPTEKPGDNPFRSMITDLRTGRSTVLPNPKPLSEGALPATLDPVLTDRGVVTQESSDLSGKPSVVRRMRKGLEVSGRKVLLDGTAPDAMEVMEVSANDTAVTALVVPDADGEGPIGLSNSTTPKLWQAPAAGGTWQRMSCNRGEQRGAGADTGTRVVWADATNGLPAIVTAAKPAGRCS